jgi:Co/Zn/Cd efflux system component
MYTLMEGAPLTFNLNQLRVDILECGSEDIVDMHNLHVWSISNDKKAMTVHIKSKRPMHTLAKVTEMCKKKHRIFHTTI